MRRVLATVAATLAGAAAFAADPPMRHLSAKEIGTRVVGKTLTDEAHWSDHFHANARLESVDLGQAKEGSWKLAGDELCLLRKARKGVTTDCFEVWLWKDHVELRRDGVTVVEGVLRDK